MPTTTPIKMDTSDPFLLRNTGKKSVTFNMPGRKFVIGPGKEQFVTFDVIRIYFGDPRSIMSSRRMYEDSRGKGTIPARETEVDRLKTLYGVYGEDQKVKDELGNDTGIYKTLTFVAPAIDIFTSTGTQIFPPLFDRKGDHQPLNAQSVSDINDIDDLSAIIVQQQKQLDSLMSRRDSVRTNGDNSDEDVEVDMEDDNSLV